MIFGMNAKTDILRIIIGNVPLEIILLLLLLLAAENSINTVLLNSGIDTSESINGRIAVFQVGEYFNSNIIF